MVRTIAVRGGPFFILFLFCLSVQGLSHSQRPPSSPFAMAGCFCFCFVWAALYSRVPGDLCESHGRNREFMQPHVYSLSYVLVVHMRGVE